MVLDGISAPHIGLRCLQALLCDFDLPLSTPPFHYDKKSLWIVYSTVVVGCLFFEPLMNEVTRFLGSPFNRREVYQANPVVPTVRVRITQ